MTLVQQRIALNFEWQNIDIVLLDMDGTLLDKYYDDYFWEQYVPQQYAKLKGIPLLDAEEKLLKKYKAMEKTLEWTDLDYWSSELGLDIPDLKLQIAHLINVHPYVIEFLKFCRKRGKKIYLVTNAHGKTLKIKMAKTDMGNYFDRIICSEEIGVAKENQAFWPDLKTLLNLDFNRTLLADDNEEVLLAAREAGLSTLIYVAKPSSKDPVKYSSMFPSIIFFKELMV